MPKEKFTFYGYQFSKATDLVRLGNIVWDYRNPTHRKPYVDKGSYLSNAAWVSNLPLSPCTFSISKSGGLDFDIGLDDFIKANGHNSSSENVLVEASDAERIEIKDATAFFEEIKSSPLAKRWLEKNLSAAYTLHERGKRFFKRPKLWFLTGVYLIKDGTFTSQKARASGTGFGISAPVDPTTVAKVGGNLNLGLKTESLSRVQIKGESIWAAQWVCLKAAPVRIGRGEEGENPESFDVEVTEQYSEGNTRDDKRIVFRITLEEDEDLETADEDDWQDFDLVLESDTEESEPEQDDD